MSGGSRRRITSLPNYLKRNVSPEKPMRATSDRHIRYMPVNVFQRSFRNRHAPQLPPEEETLARACRVRVNVVAAKELKRTFGASDNVRVALLKLKVENHTWVSREIRVGGIEEDGSFKVNQSFTFDVKDPNNAVLSIHVWSKSRLGGRESLGKCLLMRISDLLNQPRVGQDVKPQWYDLYSKNSMKIMPGKILMDIVAGIAEPEHNISLFLGTWNVGNARPPKDLSSWLPTNSEHELLIIGAQECEYTPWPPYTDCGKDWINTIKSCIGTRYKLLCGISRSQIRLAAFVRDDAEKAIAEIDSGSEATGLGHVMANKGAVSIAFKFWDTELCFINSHLAAHVGYCEVRNNNYREIVENLSISYQGMDVLNKFHHVFWMGDLNYRLDFGNVEDKTLTPDKSFWQKTVDKIKAGDYKPLLEHDELRREVAASKAFYGFKEGEITFAPTFKMHSHEASTYSEKRLPAWCDRILCRSFEGCYMEITSYFSSPNITTSDHKPVGTTVSLTAYALPSKSELDGKNWHIIFTSLEAEGLRSSDINGYSDPYVSFEGANLLHEFHSKVKFRTLNPVWNPAKDLPKLVVTASSLHRLEHEYLLCHVLDFNYALANDTLGYGAIPLRGLVAAFRKNPNDATSFKIELLHRGLPAGILMGSMELTWEKNFIKHKPSFADGLLGRTLSFRKSLKRTFFVTEHFH